MLGEARFDGSALETLQLAYPRCVHLIKIIAQICANVLENRTSVRYINCEESEWRVLAMKTNTVKVDEGMYGDVDYESFLKRIKDIRKENITVTELCDRLNAQRTSIYRIERAEVDPKLSTLMQYLNGFGYHLAVVPDKEPKIDLDYIADVNGTSVQIEQFDLNRAKNDKEISGTEREGHI